MNSLLALRRLNSGVFLNAFIMIFNTFLATRLAFFTIIFFLNAYIDHFVSVYRSLLAALSVNSSQREPVESIKHINVRPQMIIHIYNEQLSYHDGFQTAQ